MSLFFVSVIIPTYNRAKQTLTATESVLRQARGPEKVIGVDDGSPEDCRQELIRNLTKYPVQLVLRVHSGHPGRVRNTGMPRVETTQVAFLDSDDFWLPGETSHPARDRSLWNSEHGGQDAFLLAPARVSTCWGGPQCDDLTPLF